MTVVGVVATTATAVSLCLGGALSCALRIGDAGDVGVPSVAFESATTVRDVEEDDDVEDGDGDLAGDTTTLCTDFRRAC